MKVQVFPRAILCLVAFQGLWINAVTAAGLSKKSKDTLLELLKREETNLKEGRLEDDEELNLLDKLLILVHNWLPPGTDEEEVPHVGDPDWGPNVVDDSHRKCGGVKKAIGPLPSEQLDGLSIPGLNGPSCGQKGLYKKLSLEEKLREILGLSKKGQNKIVGGEDSRKYEWPFMASLQFRLANENSYMHVCGGTLIADRWVLTAAHCFHLRDPWENVYIPNKMNTCDMRVVLREHDLTETRDAAMEMDIQDIFIHPKYEIYGTYNDIALLRLAEVIGPRESWVRPSCMPDLDTELQADDTCTIVGWGAKHPDSGLTSPTLRDVGVDILTLDDCTSIQSYLRPTQICAGNLEGGKDSCSGDSGGPLLCEKSGRQYLYGITSAGHSRCGAAGTGAIYTKVSKYMIWIETVLRL